MEGQDVVTKVFAVDKPSLPPFNMPERFRHDITHFVTPPGTQGVPDELPPGIFWVRLEDARRVFDDGVLLVVSPLDSASRTEIELTEEHEAWLAWMIDNEIEQVRLG
jgi:hypothetical protein